MLLALALASAEDESAKGQGKAPSPSQIHLYLDGQWNMDSDVFIYPDDTYVYHTYSDKDRKTVRKLTGKSKGLFLEVIGLVEKFKMWTFTADSLKQDLQKAQIGKGGMGVSDANHEYLTITFGGQMLKADFYATHTFSSHYPDAKELAAFDNVTQVIIRKTEKREQVVAPNGP